MEFLLDDDLDNLAPPVAEPAAADLSNGNVDDGVGDDPPPQDPVPPDAAWFEAASPFGPVSLCVQNGGLVRHAAAAAVALQQSGPLLDSLDDWTALELDWRWTAVPQAADAGSHVVVRWPAEETSPITAHLVLPWSLVRHLPAPTGILADGVHWEPAQATVVVARLALGSDEFAALEPGGAVVLPDSMRPDWRGVLRAAGEPSEAGAPLVLAPPHAPQVVPRERAAGPFASESGTIDCEVRLDATPRIAVDRLAGWSPGDLGDLGARASLWRCDGAPRRCARGILMPWGDGWALAIDGVQPG
ncbi:MAG TPA: hypothetical protein VLE94_10075 [Burkholderiaceae bacterium]|nr:hypothetical protein [Burkholderiaceae bacterium]